MSWNLTNYGLVLIPFSCVGGGTRSRVIQLPLAGGWKLHVERIRDAANSDVMLRIGYLSIWKDGGPLYRGEFAPAEGILSTSLYASLYALHGKGLELQTMSVDSEVALCTDTEFVHLLSLDTGATFGLFRASGEFRWIVDLDSPHTFDDLDDHALNEIRDVAGRLADDRGLAKMGHLKVRTVKDTDGRVPIGRRVWRSEEEKEQAIADLDWRYDQAVRFGRSGNLYRP